MFIALFSRNGSNDVSTIAGNTFVLKPSEGPLKFYAISWLLKDAGLPNGVFNVVNGDKEAVDAL